MKLRFTLLCLILAVNLGIAQVVLSEDFNSPFSLNAITGWTVQNNSAPLGTLGWFQPTNTVAVFPAYNGSPNDYYAVNFNSAGTAAQADISNWLISPTVSLVNGATITFATRTSTGTTVYPDRLEVRVSPSTTNALPSGTSAVGTFSINVFSVNPSLSTNTNVVTTGSTVNGYPMVWSVYVATVSGVTGTVNGRFAFRYFVSNSGPSGVNGDYIGVDAVRYTLPCAPSITIASSNTTGICSGSSVSLTASSAGNFSTSTFTWNTGANSSSIVVTPTATTVYTVVGTNSVSCSGIATAVVNVTTSPIITVPGYTICSNPSTSVTLSASGASSYSWTTTNTALANSSTFVVSPTVTTIYTVTGYASTSPSAGLCPSTQTVAVVVSTSTLMSMSISASSSNLCAGSSATLTANSAATTYSWSTGALTSTIAITPTATTVYSVGGIYGNLPIVCAGGNSISITVNPLPTLTVAVTPSANVCSGGSITVSSSGANSYSYNFGGTTFTSNINPMTFTSPIVISNTTVQFTVTGTSTNNCSASNVSSLSVIAIPTLVINPPTPFVCVYGSITMTASGAGSYVWSGAGTSSTSTQSYNASATATNVAYTVTGSNQGCTSTLSFNLSVDQCLSVSHNKTEDNFKIYPNPFNNAIRVNNQISSVIIYNVLGEIILEENVNGKSEINTSGLPNGVYIIKSLNETGKIISSEKILKN